MAGEYILDLETVKKITGAETDEQAAVQITAVQELLQSYLGVLFIRKDIADEVLTVPYADATVFSPTYGPINSVIGLEVLNGGGTYTAYKGAVAHSKNAVQVLGNGLRAFWYAWRRAGVIGRIRISYNAGLWADYSAAPAVLGAAAKSLLDWLYNDPYALGGYQSEHLSDYSYTKGATVRGIPSGVAGILDGIKLV